MREDFDFNVQQALVDMESRIREDIRTFADQASDDATAARRVADAAFDRGAALDGRVKSIEEKIGWVIAGFGAALVAVAGFVWHNTAALLGIPTKP